MGIIHTCLGPTKPYKEPIEIGDWYSLCCEIDLKQIEDEEERQEVLECIEEGEPYPRGIWATREEALQDLEGSRPIGEREVFLE